MHLSGTTNGSANGHSAGTQNVFSTLAGIEKHRKNTNSLVTVDGHSLAISDVVSVALHGTKVDIAQEVVQRVEASVQFLEERKHFSLYGITTGFGGSADTRTSDTMALQISLLEHQLCGFLPTSASYEELALHAMPRHIIRGAMLIRINSLSRGHSGVRFKVLQALVSFLNLGLVPVVPLRGSISASGDLSPLSYIAAAICGHPDVKVFDTSCTPPAVLSAPEVLAKHNLEKITLAAKEGLGLVNGTAVSASAGSLAIFQAECLAALSQATTAMTVEAMLGQLASFDEFISDVARPHPGQVAVARNIRAMLAGSKMALSEEGEIAIQDDTGVLRQDRYSLRTSPQWLGPQLETLELARKQIETEINSTTDNPLIDVEGGRFLHGGNFQAMAVTAAMESTRLVLQNIGKLAFSQLTELIKQNRGLPSCLAGDEPSTNYHCKGLDIHAAAYTSELGYLANPVSSHVQSAEQHNQSVNSLALISARKTLESIDVLSLLMATQLYAVSQAIDLRLLDVKFQALVKELLYSTIDEHFGRYLKAAQLGQLKTLTFIYLLKRLEETPSWDTEPRFAEVARHLVGTILDSLSAANVAIDIATVSRWRLAFSSKSCELYKTLRKEVQAGGDNNRLAKDNMGATFAVYDCIRNQLGVKLRRGDVGMGKQVDSIGGNVSKVVEAIRDGRIIATVGQAMRAL